MNKEALLAQHPDLPFLSTGDQTSAESYLRSRQLIDRNEQIVCFGAAGEGNMNCTLRVTTCRRSLIVKQSRPWVEKYPAIAAPWDRLRSEARFYELTASTNDVARHMPSLIDFDSASRILVIEDLGEAADFTGIYRGQQLSVPEIADLATWLTALHHLTFQPAARRTLENRAMRELNYEHIFRFPLDRANGLDLDTISPGLRSVAGRLTDDDAYAAAVSELGKRYLSNGTTLIHGDFFPGSWLKTDRGICIIDPEFACFGPPEFDVGVFLAHLTLGKQGDDAIEALWQHYESLPGFERPLANQFAGVEIMRRLIGVAQLPLDLDLDQKAALLGRSRSMVESCN